MGTFLLTPRQAKGISEAVRSIELTALGEGIGLSPDEYVHLTDLTDGSGDIRVEFTDYPGKRYVYADGTSHSERSV